MAMKALASILRGVVSASALTKLKNYNYCGTDIEALCPGADPGLGRLKKCLEEHKEELSVGCAQALQN